MKVAVLLNNLRAEGREKALVLDGLKTGLKRLSKR